MDSPALFEVDDQASEAAIRAFVAWAGSDADVKILYTPDVLLAIDTPQRRGFLVDEVYFVTVWIARGAPELREHLDRELPNGHTQWIEKPATAHPNPEGFLSTAMAHGRPLADVKHPQ